MKTVRIGAKIFGIMALGLGLWGSLATAMPVPSELPAVTTAPLVLGTSLSFQSKILKGERTLNIWLPPSYKTSNKNYPVVYLIDGGMDEDFPHIAGIAQLGAVSATMQEVILVGIKGGNRRHDLLSPSADPQDQKEFPLQGGADTYRDFIKTEVKPLIEKNFRVGPSTVMGESFAGLFILETYLLKPDLFDNYVAVSPSLWWDKEKLAKSAPQILKHHPKGPHKIHLSIANEGKGMQDGVDLFKKAVLDRHDPDVTLSYEAHPELRHDTILHPVALNAFRWLYGKKSQFE